MKPTNTWRVTILCFLCLFGVGTAHAAKDKSDKGKFADIPGVTSPARPVVQPQAEAPPPAAPSNPPPAVAGAVIAPDQPGLRQSELLDQSTKGKRLFSFQSTDLDLRLALAQFAVANNLNIVPDNDVKSTVTIDIRDLPLNQAMRALLEAADCSWQEEEGLIRVRNTETRTFTLDYLRLSRNGRGQSTAMLSSGTGGGSGGGAGGGSGGGGGGGGGGMGGGAGGGGNVSGSSVNVSAENQIDFWKEIKEEVGFILTAEGKKTMAVNITAGLLQVTDRPSALKRVEHYLKTIDKTVHRQVDLETKLYDVTLNNQFQFGIDWVHIAEAYGGALAFGGATLPQPTGGIALQDSAVRGLNTIVGGANPYALVFSNFNTAAAINALKSQGDVEVISKPRLRTLNNQTALIKVGTETPFFAQTTTTLQSQAGNSTFSADQITTVTIGTILAITPQISGDDFVSLDISPVLTSLIDSVESPSGSATAPILDTKQASTIVRVKDGTTVILGGLIQNSRARNDTKVPVLGDIPLIGKLFTGTFRSKQKKELVIFVTPRIVRDGELSISSDYQTPELRNEKKAW